MKSYLLYRFYLLLREWAKPFSDPRRVLVLSFSFVIALGSLLLWSPAAWVPDKAPIRGLEALFTATSAVCVTGLSVRDTGGEFSFLGQLVILVLIQAGGLGILTFSNFLVVARRGRIGLRHRMLIEQTHGILPGLNPGAMIGRIFAYTFTFELLGAVILTWRFLDSNPPGRAIWLGVFHSVSAFCNAGFSLFTDSLVGRQADLWVNFVVMGLIIAGGLGTIVLADLHHYATILIHGRERRPRLIFHTRVVLWTTGGLILLGALLVVLFETHSSSMPDTFGGRLLAGLFLSVTSRTAGFNTIDTGALTNATLLTLVFFMMVGGSPGSTAGGIKTSTMAALIAHFRGQASSNPKPHLLHRRVSPEIAGKALATLFGFLTVAMTALVLLQWTEMGSMGPTAQRAAFLPHLFEVVSALCTVGLSTGVTSELSETGRGVIIACMFLGRLGPILVASSLIAVRRRDNFSYPEGNLYIG